MTRASFRTRCSRPMSRSVRCSAASSAPADNSVSISATPLTNHGWPDGGTGALRYQRDRRPPPRPEARKASSAASQAARGSP